jgi:hypothetical protein
MTQAIELSSWHKHIICKVDGHVFHVGMLHVVCHVTFPIEETWEASAPDWAKGRWQFFFDATRQWCEQLSMPFASDPTGWVTFIQ